MASWYTVASGQTINAADVNQFSNALEVPAGNTEIGYYFLAGLTNATSDVVSNWITTLNHANAPSTCTVDYSILSPQGFQTGSVTTNNLEASGFQVYGFADSSAPNHNAHTGGKYTATY